MKSKNNLIVISIDENKDLLEIVLYRADVDSGLKEKSAMKIMDIKTSELLKDGEENAKLQIGDIVISIFDRLIDKGIGLTTKKEQDIVFPEEAIFKKKADSGDSEAMNLLGLLYFK